jgi:hypothetical protein
VHSFGNYLDEVLGIAFVFEWFYFWKKKSQKALPNFVEKIK